MLLPLAPTLETLALDGNELGGTITDDIASFTKLKTLELSEMGLKGTFAHDPAYKREIERNQGNQEQGECAWNQKDFGPSETLRPFPFGRLFPRSRFPPTFLSSLSHRGRAGEAAPRVRDHHRLK